MLRMLCRSAKNLSTKMYLIADDLGLIDAGSVDTDRMKGFYAKVSGIAGFVPQTIGSIRRPLADIVETDEAVIITLELPGVEKKTIEITLIGDRLSVIAKRTAEAGWGNESIQRCESSHDIFKRTIRLPCPVKSDQAKAVLSKGLLIITLPKENPTIRAKISIE